ncbi:hypothetical protein J5N97_027389 [Dioscorea zingiberensis]|uniref:glutathione transferase n=1 Tax=Dioscorea zingiberensis TaxID=325984 RepID=A0A9D5C3W9_9LILI|nr:hypothetical protein J5N97_027389 [Dioscorea zingiberensis]
MNTEKEKVTLLSTWPSPYAMRPAIALELKGVVYELLEEVPALPIKSELLLKSNPVYKKVPVLLHRGNSISESLIILEYIDEIWASSGPSLVPTDPFDRAMARFWAVYIDDKWFPALFGFMQVQTENAKQEVVEKILEQLLLLQEAFQSCSKGKGFFSGDKIGYLDIVFGSYMSWLKAIEILACTKFLDEEKTPLLKAWTESFLSDTVVKKVVPEIDKCVEYGKVVQAKFRASSASTDN